MNLVLSCILTITALNAVSALMALIFAFVNATCLFFLMELEFVGLLFLIVYLGAVVVLFLFSVMLFNLKDVVRTKTTSFILTNLFAFIGVALLLSYAFLQNMPLSSFYELVSFPLTSLSLDWGSGTLSTSLYFIGQVIYGRSAFPIYLILASVILLIAMIGAVVLINNPRSAEAQLQSQLHQMTRGVQLTKL